MSYCKPKWNKPVVLGTLDPSLSSSYSSPAPLPFDFFFIMLLIKVGMFYIRVCKFIEGLQSSSSFGIICNNKSLPSASEGSQN
jgi:hypothetical protein